MDEKYIHTNDIHSKSMTLSPSSIKSDSLNENGTDDVEEAELENGDVVPNEITILKIEIDELRSVVSKYDITKKQLEKQISELESKNSNIEKMDKILQTEVVTLVGDSKVDAIEKKEINKSEPTSVPVVNQNRRDSSSGGDSDNNVIVDDDDVGILNDPIVQREEELITFKEKLNDATNENIQLKKDLILLQQNYDSFKAKSMMQWLMYLSPIIALIGYIILAYVS